MGNKVITYGSQAREALANGVNAVADAVKTTFGPRGRTAIIGRNGPGPGICTKDGVTVARSIQLEDPLENEGAKLCIEAATKNNIDSGDGTSVVCVLAQAMVNAGLDHVEKGANPVRIVKGINGAINTAINHVRKKSKPISNTAQIEHIATISGNDEEIGRIVAKALDSVGRDGVITIENGGQETVIEKIEGYQFDKGWVSPYFINTPRAEAVYDNCLVLVVQEPIKLAQQAAQILEQCVKLKKPVLLICTECDDDALGTFVMNREKGALPIVVVNAPYHGDKQTNILGDISIFCGGKFICPNAGFDPSTLTEDMFGSCKRVIVSQDRTTLLGGNGDKMERVKYLREVCKTGSDLDKLKCKERLAKLTEGVAMIKVGASTGPEQIEKRHRYEDALSATRAAIEEGVVPGGGFTLLGAHLKIKIPKDSDEAIGAQLVKDALLAPTRQIAINAGFDQPVNFKAGFDAARGKYCVLLSAGIVDPAKVVRTSLLNSSSIAACVLLCETLITEAKEK